MPIRFGFQQPAFRTEAPGENLFKTTQRLALKAEQLGFDSYWVMDHFIQIPPVDSEDAPILEGWTTLSALASQTSRIRLGTLVTGTPYRNPALLAKMGATLDVISQGRLFLGIGAGWFQREFDAYGWPFPPVGERLSRLDEALQVIRKIWTEDYASFQGKYYSLSDARCLPQPIQKPYPPILIGGGGEQRTLRLVAKYGDACNLMGGLDIIRHKLEVLERHCDEVGRDSATVSKSRLGSILIAENEDALLRKMQRYFPEGIGEGRRGFIIAGTPSQCIDQCKEFVEAGLDYLIFNFPDAETLEPLQLFMEEVAPSLK